MSIKEKHGSLIHLNLICAATVAETAAGGSEYRVQEYCSAQVFLQEYALLWPSY